MSHPNAALTLRARLRLARLIVEENWSAAEAAKMFFVAEKTARKWARRYRDEGVAGMSDRSSRPHHSPNRTPEPVVRQIVTLRWRHRLGPVQIAGGENQLHGVPRRCRHVACCLMCGSQGELSREHAIPAWIGRELNTTNGPVNHRYEGCPGSGISREWTAASLDIKIRKICKPCNNGWMSKLETDVQAALTPLIRGESRAMTTVECKLITRWFLKTMLMLAGGRA